MDEKLQAAVNDLKKAEGKINTTPTVVEGVVTPKVMEEVKTPAKPPVVVNATAKPKLSEEQTKLREFIDKTNSIYVHNPGTPQEKWYATQQAWSYLAAINNVEVRMESTMRDVDPTDKNATVVYASGALVDTETGRVITKATMCASTSEAWLKDKPLSAVYGLAQTRMEERLLRMRFGYQLSLAHLEPVGAEELDVNAVRYSTKNKEI